MRTVVFVLLGGLLGLAGSSGVYLGLNPVLEASSGPWREMQGLLWNLVPLSTAAGMLLGGWLAQRSSRAGPPR